MDVLSRKINIAVNRAVVNKTNDYNLLTKRFQNADLTAREIADEIKNGSAIVCAKLMENDQGATYRNNAHFHSSNIIGVDIDNDSDEDDVDENGEVRRNEHGKAIKKRVSDEKYFSWDMALKDSFISQNALLLYQTFSSKPDHNKFRIGFLLPDIITDRDEYCRIISAFIKKYGADKHCSDACRAFYGNSNCEPVVLGNALSAETLEQILSDHNKVEKKGKQQQDKRKEKSVNFPKISLCQVSAMLRCIKATNPSLGYMEWAKLAASLFEKYSFEEVFPILKEHYPEQEPGEYWEKYQKGLDRKPFKYFIDLAKECGFTKPITYGVDFVVIGYAGAVELHQKRLMDFLYKSGYRKYYLPETKHHVYTKLLDNVLCEIAPANVKDFLRDYLQEKYDGDELKEEVLNELYCGRFTASDKLDYLYEPEKELLRDDQDNAHIFLSNGFFYVHKKDNSDPCEFKQYADLRGIIWQKWKKNHKWSAPSVGSKIYSSPNPPVNHIHRNGSGMFEQFVDHICEANEHRTLAMQTALGYLLHSYKAPSLSRAIVFCDETISDHPSGGTGKSLLAHALSHVKNVAYKNDKRFNPSKRFSFQNVSTDTQIVVLDDIVRNFNFEALFHLITGDFEYERKGEHKVKIPYAVAPKLLLTTNYTVIGHGNSHRRRIGEYEIYPWYSERFTPMDDFGFEFFTQWSEEEWCRFFEFMARCIRLFFFHNLLIPTPKNLNLRKFQQETSSEFVQFMDEKYREGEGWNPNVLGIPVSKPVLFDEFCRCFPDFKQAYDQGRFKQKWFAFWLKAYAQYNNLRIEEGFARINGESTRVVSFFV